MEGRSRLVCGVGISSENPTCVRPTRDEAWMYSAISEGMPANAIALNDSTSTPCEIADVATIPRSAVAISSVFGSNGSSARRMTD